MASFQEAPNIRNPQPIRKMPVLPPKIPYQPAPAYPDCRSNYVGTIGMPVHRGGLKPRQNHQRTSSESFLTEEQPSWLDDLLDEPESPVKGGAHRRSTSDSLAYVDTLSNLQPVGLKNQNVSPQPWITEEFDCVKGMQHPPHMMEARLIGQDPRMKRLPRPGPGFQLSSMPGQVHPLSVHVAVPVPVPEKKFHDESAEKREISHTKNNQTDLEAKRAKQQFAQRSRVRKLQYIAELERHVQALQAEAMEVTAQLQFLDQQNLMISLENKVMKQQLDNLSQEHLMKCLQHDMLEREISRLRALCQQQQQQQPPVNRRNKSRDLEAQLLT